MDNKSVNSGRRELIKLLLSAGVVAPWLPGLLRAADEGIITRVIPSSGEPLPVIGMGTSRTLNVALSDLDAMTRLQAVMRTFFDRQGTLLDSSPMYGTAQAVIGKLLKQTQGSERLFSATKVWIEGKQAGIDQMQASRQLWGIERFDLMQIHNLVDWRTHLPTLNAMKAEGQLRYVGVTTSHGRYHKELEAVLKQHPLDFVQLSYNIDNRVVEKRLLPIAKDRGIAVMVNRAYQRGALFKRVKGKDLPDWAAELGIQSWGQYFLKYAVAHPAVTCVIPATSKLKHMLDNMGAQFGRLPDQKQREEMFRYFQALA